MALPVRLAASTIEATLASLLAQRHESFEVVAVCTSDDPAAPRLRAAAAGSPRLRLLETRSPAGVPQLRRDAVEASLGQLIALAEDHCVYPPDWLTQLEAALRNPAVAVSGGPVSNGRRSFAGWAQYFTRYSAFLPPQPIGLAPHLPGNNACYRADQLREHRTRLVSGFWEAEFNASLLAEGLQLAMTSSIAEQRQHRGALDYFVLRFRHGRCYGARRLTITRGTGRLRLLLGVPFIPAVLFLRAARSALPSSVASAFAITGPLVFAYQIAWAIGEAIGYVAGAGDSTVSTD